MTDSDLDVIERIKKQLSLGPHPLGYGGFKEVWTADRNVVFTSKTSHSGPRAAGSSIYFLLTTPNFLPWLYHLSDSAFFWHAGDSFKIHTIKKDGTHVCSIVGDVTKHDNCVAQVVIEHDTWFAAELVDGGKFALLSEILIPGFDIEDLADGKRQEMLHKYPQHTDLINKLSV